MPRKSRVEISSRAIDAELFEPYHEHLNEYCRVTKTDKVKLLEEFIRSLDVPEDDFPSVDDRILTLFNSLRPNQKNEGNGHSKAATRKKAAAGRSRQPSSSNKTVTQSELVKEFSLQ